MAQKNYYIILEVKNTATFEEIKSSYRMLAKKYHPDKNIGNKAAEEYFKEVQEAYAVLSNPEKRKKYDYKLSFGSRPQPQQKQNNNGPQYTGNAYQFAQQQAQHKQQQTYSQPKSKPLKTQESASWQILVSVGIALVLLYFIISYSTEKTTVNSGYETIYVSSDAEKESEAIKAMKKLQSKETALPKVTMNNYDSPYTPYFGDEIYDEQSKNSIAFLNASESEAVICLEEKTSGKVVRNLYVSNESQIKMGQIPDGAYVVRIYFGNEWDAGKTFEGQTVTGGFKIDNGFWKLYDDKKGIVMKKEKNGSMDSYSTYEIKIGLDFTQNANKIDPESFFK